MVMYATPCWVRWFPLYSFFSIRPPCRQTQQHYWKLSWTRAVSKFHISLVISIQNRVAVWNTYRPCYFVLPLLTFIVASLWYRNCWRPLFAVSTSPRYLPRHFPGFMRRRLDKVLGFRQLRSSPTIDTRSFWKCHSGRPLNKSFFFYRIKFVYSGNMYVTNEARIVRWRRATGDSPDCSGTALPSSIAGTGLFNDSCQFTIMYGAAIEARSNNKKEIKECARDFVSDIKMIDSVIRRFAMKLNDTVVGCIGMLYFTIGAEGPSNRNWPNDRYFSKYSRYLVHFPSSVTCSSSKYIRRMQAYG